MKAETIDDVIAALDAIIEQAWQKQSRIGYFAALYRRVTRAVRDGIAAGEFQNGPLLQQLDVTFASRYLDALTAFQSGGMPTRSWRVAFEGCEKPQPLILQQLLAGINAHINLDLGIAAAQTTPGAELPKLKQDFDQINEVLAEQVRAVEVEIAKVSPLIGDLERLGLHTETKIVNFDMVVARDAAWRSALRFAEEPRFLVSGTVEAQDLAVSLLGRTILDPPLLEETLRPIRNAESNDVRQVIEALSQSAAVAAAAGSIN